MHTMITRPRGMKIPHMICEGEEGGLDEMFVLLTPKIY